jgi:anti-anti-sigma factor
VTERARFSISSDRDIPVLDVIGEVDIGNIEDFDAALRDVAACDAGAIVISLERARYIDSRTVHSLALFINRMTVNRQALFFALPPASALNRLLEFTGLLQIMTVLPDKESAVARARALFPA